MFRLPVLLISLAVGICLPASASAALESWYTHWAIGLASHDYPGSMNAAMDALDSVPGVQRSEVSLEMLGLYWPVADGNTLLGLTITGSGDRLDDGRTSLQFNQYLYGISTMWFFGREPGDGFFLRGDAGIAKMMVLTSSGGYDSRAVSDAGFGLLGGAGFGFPISHETRLLFSVTHAVKHIEGDALGVTAFSLSGLW